MPVYNQSEWEALEEEARSGEAAGEGKVMPGGWINPFA